MALLPGIGQTHHVFIRWWPGVIKIKLWHNQTVPCNVHVPWYATYVDTNTQ